MKHPSQNRRLRFLSLVKESLRNNTLIKITLAKPGPVADNSLKKLLIRPVLLKDGPNLSFTFRHNTRDITKNYSPAKGFSLIRQFIGVDFLDAHLFTTEQIVQLQMQTNGLRPTLSFKPVDIPPVETSTGHDIPKKHPIPANASWLQDIGITNPLHQPRKGMADKFRQIQKFIELLGQLVSESSLKPGPDSPIKIYDMGAGKGYLTFGIAEHFKDSATVVGIESRPELVESSNIIAQRNKLDNLRFEAGSIDSFKLPPLDILVALHACDTATDDAIAQGISSGAQLIICSPCCQKELRPQLSAPEVLRDALKHGIFQERQAEFATDALRAMLLEWAGYQVKVFEFISTEHTAKNLMISAVKRPQALPEEERDSLAERIRDFAIFYGIKSQSLAKHLNFKLV